MDKGMKFAIIEYQTLYNLYETNRAPQKIPYTKKYPECLSVKRVQHMFLKNTCFKTLQLRRMTKDDLYLKIDEKKTYKMHLLIKTLFLLM